MTPPAQSVKLAGLSFPPGADSKKQGTPWMHRVTSGQQLRNHHKRSYLNRSHLPDPPCSNQFALRISGSLLQVLKEDVGSMAMFLSARPWESMLLDFQKSSCCLRAARGGNEVRDRHQPVDESLARESGNRTENGEKRCSWSCFPSYSQHGSPSCAHSEVWCCKEKFQTHYSFMLESVDLIL